MGEGYELSVALPPEVIERIAQRAAQIMGEGLATEARWLRGAKAIAEYIAAPVGRVYDLSSAGRIPVEHDGSNLLAHTSDLDEWIRSGGGVVP